MTKDELRGLLQRGSSSFKRANKTNITLQDPVVKCDQTPALGSSVQGKTESLPSVTVRFIGHRCKPLDPDNFAAGCKDLLDGLRYAKLIPGDEPWRIRFETTQVKVSSRRQERTEIEIIYQE